MTDLSAKPFSTNLEKYTFSQNVHIYQQSGCIGYLRADLGTSGKEFHSTWNEICSAFKTEEFSREFDDVINALRFDETFGRMLNDRTKLSQYCHSNAKQFSGADNQYYGVRVDTKNHSYLLRLNPNKGEYNLYCYCYDKQVLENYLIHSSKGIRFITPSYKPVFTISDGDKIRIITPEGEQMDRVCRYIDDYHLLVDKNLFHICEFAEKMKENNYKVIPLRSSLPERCYGVMPTSDRLIIIQKGETKYTDVSNAYDSPEKNRELANEHNAEMGVSKQQSAAMLAGLIAGWDTHGANPENYDINAKLKPMITRNSYAR